MRCPTLAELPTPLHGKTGWPWTEETPPCNPCRWDGSSWPRISIVTPSFNHGMFIEESIRSILLQNYPNVEFIIVDGNSTDCTIEIIEKYSRWITIWLSERDRGQADAINKGLERSTGNIFQFINSDDILAVGALAIVGQAYRPGYAIAGAVMEFSPSHTHLVPNMKLGAARMLRSTERTQFCQYHQPGVWLDLLNLRDLGGFKSELNYCFDYENIVRYLSRWPNVIYVDDILVYFRIHPSAKTSAQPDKVKIEYDAARENLSKELPSWRLRRHARIGLQKARSFSKIAEIYENKKGKFAVFIALLNWMICNPYAACTRFALGALKNAAVMKRK